MKFQPFAIGKYEFVEFLGRGGFAEVYRVCLSGPQGFQKEFAIKRVLPGFITDPEVVRMFEVEANLTSLLNHANIVHVFEFIKSSGNYFLVMEYIHGKNLSALLKQLRSQSQTLPLDIALYICVRICEGLDYAHNKKHPRTGEAMNIIHRDISPQNIMLSLEGGVKIVDFGIAKTLSNSSETKTGRTKGKLAYMSPEQALGKSLDVRSDIFSASALFYEILAHRRLFEGDNEMQIIRQVQDCAIPHLQSTIAQLPLALREILITGLAANPNDRFQAISEMQSLLQDYLHRNYPDLSPRRLADWLEQILKAPVDEVPTTGGEFTPLAISEENFLKDGFARLEEEIYNQSKIVDFQTKDIIAAIRPEIPPDLPPKFPKQIEVAWEIPPQEASKSSVLFPVLSVIAVIMAAALGFGVYYNRHSVTREISENKIPPPVVVTPSKENPVVTTQESMSKLNPVAVPNIVEETVAEEAEEEFSVITPSTKVEKKENPPSINPVEKISGKSKPKVTAKSIPKAPAPPPISDFERLGASIENNAAGNTSLKAKTLYQQGMEAFVAERYEEANAYFHQSRMLKNNYLPSWLYEIKSLEKLNSFEMARAVAQKLLKIQPEAKSFPGLAPYLDSKRDTLE